MSRTKNPILGMIMAFLGVFSLVVLSLVAAVSPAAAQSAGEAESSSVGESITGVARQALPQLLDLSKSVDSQARRTLVPGETFTYQIKATCSETDCLDALLIDELPAQLEGFRIISFTSSPSAVTVPHTPTWKEAGVVLGSRPERVGPSTSFEIEFNDQTLPGGPGLDDGTTLYVNLSLEVPADFSPDNPLNGVDIENRAEITASNSAPAGDRAVISVAAEQTLDAYITKRWIDANAPYNPGALSTIRITAGNESNVAVERLIVQDPGADNAVPGAAQLDEANPFRYVDFAGFDSESKLPAGADTVQVDAYVQIEGNWVWVAGTPSQTFELPADISNDQVAGLRFTFAGDNIAQHSDALIVSSVAQRSADRLSGESMTDATDDLVIRNDAQARVTEGEESSPIEHSQATHTLTPAEIGVAILKTISPDRLAPGVPSTGTIGVRNQMSPVESLAINDYDSESPFFTADANTGPVFTGFTEGIDYPNGAQSGVMTFYGPGEKAVAVAFGDGETPAVPAGFGPVLGFSVLFEGDGNSITADASTTIKFGFTTDKDFVFPAESGLVSFENRSTATATAANGNFKTNESKDDLTVVEPRLKVDLEKTAKPNGPLTPGQTIVTSLRSTVNTHSDFATPKTVVIEDAWDGTDATGFWNAFDLTSVQPTQIPAGASLDVLVKRGDDWVPVQSFPADTAARTVKVDADQLGSAVTGIRFVFANEQGFANAVVIDPYLSFTARATLRDGGEATASSGEAVQYQNLASVDVTGVSTGGAELSDHDEDLATGEIIGLPDNPVIPGPLGRAGEVDKTWNESTIGSQTQAQAQTKLAWRLNQIGVSGYPKVQISDPAIGAGTAKPGATETTVYDTFDLVSVLPISSAGEAYSNGWYLRYDTITKLELFNGTDWVEVVPAEGSWQSADGSFIGYELTDAERETTLGLRISIAENQTARENALTGNNGQTIDPYAPVAGSGVASSSTMRSFDLVWELRNKTRVGDNWVEAERSFNVLGEGNEGIIDNRFAVEAIPAEGDPDRLADNDTIRLVNQPPSVTVGKVSENQRLIVPPNGSPDSAYPTNKYTITARNASVMGAQYLRVTDPTTCTEAAEISECLTSVADAKADPYTGLSMPMDDQDTFNRLDITNITVRAEIADEVDLGASTAWLLFYDPVDGYSTEQTTAAAINARADFTGVVGVSVTFQGANPEQDGGSITQANRLFVEIDTKVRSTLRNDGASQDLTADVTVNNRAVAQSYNGIVYENSKVGNLDVAPLILSSGRVDITPTKSISDGLIVEANPSEVQTVTLEATEGRSEVAPWKVVLEDQAESVDFWNNFDFVGLGQLEFPSSADRVEIAVYGPFGEDGTKQWVASEAQASDAESFSVPVPAERYGEIEGVRFAYSKSGEAEKNLFAKKKWTARADYQVALRETVRGTDTPVVFPGAAENTLSAQSFGQLTDSQVKTASADVHWNGGTTALQINKLANEGTRLVSPGTTVPWDLTIHNSGTGYLDLEQVVDVLPAHLTFTGAGGGNGTGDPYSFTPDSTLAGALLTTKPVLDASTTGELVFTWPEGQNRMMPGETVSIRVWLEFQPGLLSGQRATNQLLVDTVQPISSCTALNLRDGSGGVVFDPQQDPTECLTSDYVSPTAGANVYVVKGVKGALDGATNQINPDVVCQPTLESDGQLFYRTPCVANSSVGLIDTWVLRTVNAGTVDIMDAIVFDALPNVDDKLLIQGNPRGSTHRPELTKAPKIVGMPEGTEARMEVTNSVAACDNTWPALPEGRPCEQNKEVWTDANEGTDWSQVTAFRISFDFTAAGGLAPGEGIDVIFENQHSPQTEVNPAGADIEVPTADQFAWNQFGATYMVEGASKRARITPAQVGSHLRTGSMEIDKFAIGKAATFAPAAIDALVSCQIGETPLTWNGEVETTVTLSKNSAGTYDPVRLYGIPVGAECTVVEAGELGQYGEVSRQAEQAKVIIQEADDRNADGQPRDDKVPAAQITTLRNTYEWGSLSVSKRVDTQATVGELGPFQFSLACVAPDGRQLTFDGNEVTTFALAPDGVWKSPAETIPAGSTCTLTETDDGGADGVVFTGDGVTADGRSAVIEIGVGNTAVESVVTNRFASGTLTVQKVVEGDGAQKFGQGNFELQAVCVRNDAVLLDETFTLAAGQTKTFGVFPSGTECQVEETATGGANSTTLDPEDGVVTIGSVDEVDPVEQQVSVSNRFDVASLQIIKERKGPAVELLGTGSFTAQAVCTYNVDGKATSVPLDGNGVVTLSAANKYRATLPEIPVGAECAVAEIDAGAAVRSEVSGNGFVTISEEGDNSVTITNYFEVPPTEKETTKQMAMTGANAGWNVLAVLLLAALGSAALMIGRRRNAK